MTQPSGVLWVPRFPSSTSPDDLDQVSGFQDRVKRFIAALKAAGALVVIGATYRPAERAYLMHYCCLIAGYRDQSGVFHQIDPSAVPAMAGVDIDWTHGGDIGAARAAAVAMKTAYAIVYPASLESRHTQRLAIDMTITVHAGSTITDANGAEHQFTTQASGMYAGVIAIGKTFGVIKLVTDPPHWSSDGR